MDNCSPVCDQNEVNVTTSHRTAATLQSKLFSTHTVRYTFTTILLVLWNGGIVLQTNECSTIPIQTPTSTAEGSECVKPMFPVLTTNKDLRQSFPIVEAIGSISVNPQFLITLCLQLNIVNLARKEAVHCSRTQMNTCMVKVANVQCRDTFSSWYLLRR
jgi:hypothetical protein